MKKLLPLFVLIICLLCSFTYAQSIVKGTITDKSGAPMVGATITLKNETTGKTNATSAGLDGSYTFKNVAAGQYKITAVYISYNSTEKQFTVGDGATIINLSLEDKSSVLTEVNVGATASKATDRSAINAERQSDVVLNAVSARTIETSPDITIANVMQRISGVSVERSNNGEAQYAIIRGMDQRYIYTLVNGLKIPSPDNKNRYVPLDIFPADIVDRLEVSKSLTADMEGDAIGGAINMVLKEAPDNFTVHANLGTGYASNFFDNSFTKFDHSASLTTSPRVANGSNYLATMANFPNNPFNYSNIKVPLATIAGLSVGGRSADKKFGAIVTLSYQNTYRGTNGTFFGTSVNGANNAAQLTSVESRNYDIQQQRTSVVTKFDYKFNANNKLTLDADYINLTQNEYRFTSDTSLLTSRPSPGIGSADQDYRSDRTVQQIYNFDLRGDHRLANNFSINWTTVYSKATANEPDRADLNISTGTAVQPDGSVEQLPKYFDTDAETRIFEKNSDQDKSGYLNFVYTPTLFNTKVTFTAGGMYRDKTRTSTYDDYEIRQSANNTTQTYNGNLADNSFFVFDPQGTAANALDYDFTEKIGAAYGEFKFTAGNLLAQGGVRYEHTGQSWETGAPINSIVGVDGSISYFDVMPSVNLKYTLDSKQDIRFSYYSAISRPNFYELVPHVVGDPDADYTEDGNPDLKRTTSNNYDLRYELFPKGLDQLLVGAFYKTIQNPIEYAVEPPPPGGTEQSLKPENFGNATNYGFEFDATKFFNSFGIRANYTYTNSDITTDKLQDYRDANGFLTHRTVQQTRPLQDQSKNIANLSFLYREPKSGFDAQVSMVYTGSRIYAVSPYLDNDIWQKAFTSLDVSAEKKVYKNLFVYAKATNLLNTPFQLEIHSKYPAGAQAIEDQQVGQNVFVRKDTYGQYYMLGIRYKL